MSADGNSGLQVSRRSRMVTPNLRWETYDEKTLNLPDSRKALIEYQPAPVAASIVRFEQLAKIATVFGQA